MGRGLLNHLRLGDGLRASSRAVLPLMVMAGLAGDALLSAPEALLDLLTIATLFVWTALIASSCRDGASGSRGKSQHTGDARPLVLSLFVMATLAGIAIRLVDGPTEVVALALFVVGADRVLRRADRPDETLPAAALALLLFALVLLLELHSAHARFSIDLVARGVSSIVSWLVPGTVSVGAGLLGIRLVALALLYTLSIAVLGEGTHRYRTAALTGGSLVASSLAYAVGWTWLSELERVQTAAGLLRPLAAPYDFRLLLLMLLAVPLVFARAAIAPRATTRASDARSHRAAAAVSLCLAAAVLLMSAQAGATGPSHRVIVLDTTGQIEHDVPTYDRYGLENLGQFGMLPRYLQATGLSGGIVDEITPGVLADADTLVVLNLRERLSDAARESVWAFVEAGGGLLVAGDHTGAEEIRDPSNHLLEPVGISLGFDSAIPLSDRWASGFEMASHPVFRGIAEDELQVVIGASLSVAPPARPVLIGRAGYSDAGDMTVQRPILLANPNVAFSQAVLVPSEASSAFILGGTSAVSTGVQTALNSELSGTVARLAGATRYETAVRIAEHGVSEGLHWNGIGIATGKNFPDALSGGAMLGRMGSVMLLTLPTSLPDVSRAALQDNAASIDAIFIFGGTGAVSTAVEQAAESAAGVL